MSARVGLMSREQHVRRLLLSVRISILKFSIIRKVGTSSIYPSDATPSRQRDSRAASSDRLGRPRPQPGSCNPSYFFYSLYAIRIMLVVTAELFFCLHKQFSSDASHRLARRPRGDQRALGCMKARPKIYRRHREPTAISKYTLLLDALSYAALL